MGKARRAFRGAIGGAICGSLGGFIGSCIGGAIFTHPLLIGLTAGITSLVIWGVGLGIIKLFQIYEEIAKKA